MASTQLAGVVRHIHQIVGPPVAPELSDAHLLQCFLADRDETAFRLLMERHGRMVLSVCRYVLRQRQDAEDAFQATFLILAQNAASIRNGAALASWLYGVAYRTALNARSRLIKRRQHERRAGKMAYTEPALDLALQELQAVLAEEVNRLAEKHRAPFVLCCLNGLSKSEAARRLGWKEGTVSGRLAEARKRLQQRLARRGLTLSAALCAGAWSASARAGVSSILLRTTLQAALGVAVGQTTAAIAPEPVVVLVEGAKQTIFLSKLKLVSVMVLVASLAIGGIGIHLLRTSATAMSSEQPAVAAAPKADKPAPPKTPAEKGDQITVSGRILDSDDKPIAGAKVFLLGPRQEQAENAQQKSGLDGLFGFRITGSELSKDRIVAATAEGYALDWIDVEKADQGEITLRLARDKMPISGRVLDLQGRPIKDITVRVMRIEAPPQGDLDPVLKSIHREGDAIFQHPMRALNLADVSKVIAPVRTDEAGRFRFSGVGGERLAILRIEGPTIEHKTLYVLARPGVDVKQLLRSVPKVKADDGPVSPLPPIYGPTFDHLAGPTRPIVGVVRARATGKPVAEVIINGDVGGRWEDQVYAKTDQEGRYRLVGLPKAPSFHVYVWGEEQHFVPVGKTIGDREGLGPIALDFELIRGVRVRGRITDKATGKPVPAALWYCPLADNKYYTRLSGKYEYLFEGMGHRNEKDGSFSLLALPGSGLIKVRAEVQGKNSYPQVALDDADRPKACMTNEYNEGMGEHFLSAAGAYTTLLGHHAYRLIDPPPDAGSITCDIQFERGVSRRGTVVDPDGKPLSGVRVRGLAGLWGDQILADSTFQAIALNPRQPRLLTFIHKEHKLVGHVLLRADATEPVIVRLRPGCVLTGRLVDENGKPLAGVHISPSYSKYVAPWGSEERTDTDGRFRIEGIFPDLQFTLHVRKNGEELFPEKKCRNLALSRGSRDLGDIVAKSAADEEEGF